MTCSSESVFGIFKNSETSFSCVKNLKNIGFRESDISLLLMTEPMRDESTSLNASGIPSAILTYAATGAILGGIFGILSGIGFFAVSTAVSSAFINSMIALFAGVGIGGSVGSLAGVLIGLGNIQMQSERHDVVIENGGVLISVHADNTEWLSKAKDLLTSTGANNVSVVKNIRFEPTPTIINRIQFPISDVIIPQVPDVVTTNRFN